MKYIIKDWNKEKIFNNEREFYDFLKKIEESIYFEIKINENGDVEYVTENNLLEPIYILNNEDFIKIRKSIEDFANNEKLSYEDVLDYLS